MYKCKVYKINDATGEERLDWEYTGDGVVVTVTVNNGEQIRSKSMAVGLFNLKALAANFAALREHFPRQWKPALVLMLTNAAKVRATDGTE